MKENVLVFHISKVFVGSSEANLCGNMKPLARESWKVLRYIGMLKIV